MDLKTEIKKYSKDVDNIFNMLTKQTNCVVCNKINTHKDGKLQEKCSLNIYNNTVRAILCQDCNIIENRVRNNIEIANMSYFELKNRFDESKL